MDAYRKLKRLIIGQNRDDTIGRAVQVRLDRDLKSTTCLSGTSNRATSTTATR